LARPVVRVPLVVGGFLGWCWPVVGEVGEGRVGGVGKPESDGFVSAFESGVGGSGEVFGDKVAGRPVVGGPVAEDHVSVGGFAQA